MMQQSQPLPPGRRRQSRLSEYVLQRTDAGELSYRVLIGLSWLLIASAVYQSLIFIGVDLEAALKDILPDLVEEALTKPFFGRFGTWLWDNPGVVLVGLSAITGFIGAFGLDAFAPEGRKSRPVIRALLGPFREDLFAPITEPRSRVDQRRPAMPLHAPEGSAARRCLDAVMRFAREGAHDRSNWFQVRNVEVPFRWALLTGASGTGKSRIAEHAALSLAKRENGDDGKSARLLSLLRESLFFLKRDPEADAWDVGFLDADSESLKDFIPRRPTLLLMNDPPIGEATKLVARLSAASRTWRTPVRLLVINQTRLAELDTRAASSFETALPPLNNEELIDDPTAMRPLVSAAVALEHDTERLKLEQRLVRQGRDEDFADLHQRTGGNPLVLEVLVQILRDKPDATVHDYPDAGSILDEYAKGALMALTISLPGGEANIVTNRLRYAVCVSTLAGNPGINDLSKAMVAHDLGGVDPALQQALARVFPWSRHTKGFEAENAAATNAPVPGFEPDMLADSITHLLVSGGASDEQDRLAVSLVSAALAANPAGALRTMLRRLGETRHGTPTPIARAFRRFMSFELMPVGFEGFWLKEVAAAFANGTLELAVISGMIETCPAEAMSAVRKTLIMPGLSARRLPVNPWCKLGLMWAERHTELGLPDTPEVLEILILADLVRADDGNTAIAIIARSSETEFRNMFETAVRTLETGRTYAMPSLQIAMALMHRQDVLLASARPSRTVVLSRIRLLGACLANQPEDPTHSDHSLRRLMQALGMGLAQAWRRSNLSWQDEVLVEALADAVQGRGQEFGIRTFGYGIDASDAISNLIDAALQAEGLNGHAGWNRVLIAEASAMAACTSPNEAFDRINNAANRILDLRMCPRDQQVFELWRLMTRAAQCKDNDWIVLCQEIDYWQTKLRGEQGGVHGLALLCAIGAMARSRVHQVEQANLTAQWAMLVSNLAVANKNDHLLADLAAFAWYRATYAFSRLKEAQHGREASLCAERVEAHAGAGGRTVGEMIVRAWDSVVLALVSNIEGGSDAELKLCAERAETHALAGKAADARRIALAWSNAAGAFAEKPQGSGSKNAKQCAARAEAHAVAGHQLVAEQITRAWANAAAAFASKADGSGSKDARECAARAEAHAVAGNQLIAEHITMAWVNAAAAFGGKAHGSGSEEARRCAARAEAHAVAGSLAVAEHIASAWSNAADAFANKVHGSGSNDAKQCAERAEAHAVAGDPAVSEQIVIAWASAASAFSKKVSAGSEGARQCAERAEAHFVAGNTHVAERIAAAWSSAAAAFLNEEHESIGADAKQCAERAEAYAVAGSVEVAKEIVRAWANAAAAFAKKPNGPARKEAVYCARRAELHGVRGSPEIAQLVYMAWLYAGGRPANLPAAVPYLPLN